MLITKQNTDNELEQRIRKYVYDKLEKKMAKNMEYKVRDIIVYTAFDKITSQSESDKAIANKSQTAQSDIQWVAKQHYDVATDQLADTDNLIKKNCSIVVDGTNSYYDSEEGDTFYDAQDTEVFFDASDSIPDNMPPQRS